MTTLLTGATGFVGMQVLARLLGAGEEVACIVRGDDAPERVDGVLATMGVTGERRDAVRVVRGDVTAPLADVPGVTTVVHCAASVSFGLSLEDARASNVGGTRHALEAADRAGARYVHVSTAYVAGRRRGFFREGDLDCGQAFRNTYEQAKFEAECLVAAARPDAVVLRPSIVMGESSSGWTSAFNVLYWPLRAFDRGLLPAIPATPGGRVDVVPVDYVADAIAHVVLERPDVAGPLHLVAGHHAPTVADLVAMAAEAFGREAPPLVPVDPSLAERSPDAARYLPYFDMEVVFDDARARAVLEPAGLVAPLLEVYFDRLVAFARAARWGKRPVARADVVGALQRA